MPKTVNDRMLFIGIAKETIIDKVNNTFPRGRRSKMHYIILDLEWNQKGPRQKTAKKNVEMPFEIIQIGAVKVSEFNEMTDSVRYNIKPTAYTHMNTYIQDITGITDNELSKGRPFAEVINEFREWCGNDFIFMTWGNGDMPVLKNNLEYHGIDTSWLPECVDLQPIFNNQITGDKRQYSVTHSMQLVGETMELKAHDALNDSINTYKIFKHLDFDPATHKPRQLGYNDLFSFSVDHCSDIDDVLYDEDKLEMECPLCGKRVYFDDPVQYADMGFVAYGACPKDHEFAQDFICEETGSQPEFEVKRNIFFLTEPVEAYFNRKLDYYDKLLELNKNEMSEN